MRAYAAERRAVARAHGQSRLGCLPLLLQLPVWFGLYRLLADVAGGSQVGAMGADLVAGLAVATVLGVPLVHHARLEDGPAQFLVVAGLGALAAGLAYATQRWFVAPNQSSADLPDAVQSLQAWLPVVAASGALVAAAFVPVALLVYWVCNATWSLGQAAVIARWFPTPGTPAAARRDARTP